ncbi:MAG: 4-hydroxythreonine-4-phosphate dehydrogenase PdxA [Propionibacteriaceae bacterium]|jgi:4-hydroxythreonine-4-phosphate dehydrogenase|nr:4-hydroxythreonine-4-phosphate dehydrogenase PdxA [Propionibacteriaceae bacterium]
MPLPVLAVTLGDVAGVGPEIVAATLLAHPELRELCLPVAVGDAGALRRGAAALGLDPGAVRVVACPADALGDPSLAEIVQVGPPLPELPWGKLSAKAGDAAYRYVLAACDLAKTGQVTGIVTAPLNKEAMWQAGHKFPGHTEILAHEFGVHDYSMILSAGDLYLFHLTTHVALRRAIELCTTQRAISVLRLAGALGRALGKPDARIGLAGLNPHAGEHGLFGDEDETQLRPAVLAAQRLGLNVEGPLSADALIPQAVRGAWDMVVACYHDQGHVAFKSVFGNAGVNITAGLPIIRVSVDHGTAFDIAGRGLADEESLVLACRRAAELGPSWREVWDVLNAPDTSR